MTTLSRALFAEFIGTAMLLAAVVGSGIMGQALSQGNDGITLLANAGATAAMLYVLIVIFGPISGAHFNPAVTISMRLRGDLDNRATVSYVVVQVVAAVAGVALAHAMFGMPLVQSSLHVRTGWSQWGSEAAATFGLVLTIFLGARYRPASVPALVASYIFAAYWFTASTSFANPAVTVARALTGTFAGIRLVDVFGFVASQLLGAMAAIGCVKALLPLGDSPGASSSVS